MSNQGFTPLFKVGQQVDKAKGYSFPGTIVSIFNTLDGAMRMVVESDAPKGFPFHGILHIFSPENLVPRPESIHE